MIPSRSPFLLAPLILVLAPLGAAGQEEVTLEKIMAHPDWIGRAPESFYWADDGQSFFYERKIEDSEERELLQSSLGGAILRQVGYDERGAIDVGHGQLSRDLGRKIYSRRGDVYLKDLGSGAIRQITRTAAEERDPFFMADGDGIAFERDGSFFARRLSDGLEYQVADLRLEEDPREVDEDEGYLTAQQERLFDYIRDRKQEKEAREDREREEQRADPTRAPLPFYLGDDIELAASSLSPNGRWLLLVTAPADRPEDEATEMPLWVTESGDIEVREVRAKVGSGEPFSEQLLLLDLDAHTTHPLDLAALPTILDDPLAELREATEARRQATEEEPAGEKEAAVDDDAPPKPRPVGVLDLQWTRDGERVAVMLESRDNKDRWIATVDFDAPALRALHHLHDPAWVNYRYNDFGWLPDDETLFYLSEEEGYAGLYRVRTQAGAEPARLAGGAFVISEPQPSHDGSVIYYRANPEHPGRYEIYRVDVATGESSKITALGGVSSAKLSGDGERLLIEHSTTTRPPELYVQDAVPGATARRVTETVSSEFEAVDWTVPEIVAIPSSRVERPIYSRLYLPPPQAAAPGDKRPAVLFVHGAGYLQNAHEGWSGYFREFMFHTLLARRGYVVLDMDYRASAGYGRDWRTAIYRQMGTPELEDLQDGVAWLVANQNVDPARVGVYGGSYGGFMTMMALFKEPELFAAGAALRPVTDWAHYNHGYTSNILNTPELDPEAYEASSPIEFAAGLEKPLLICAPMLDDNVFFQDTVRLVQRLIELEKITFETALYPIEPHGFREPSSWLNEYRRIYNLFERYVRPAG
jgi:dipeptidyl aminopeptidase/acylaminoacyl peptidase